MNHPSFPTGHASAAILKALARALSAEKGDPQAEAWLRSIRTLRADLDDETRLLPLATIHRALLAFVEVGGRDAIPRSWKYLIEPDLLGAWVRVLRGTTEPGEALARLEASDSAYGRTTRWETVALGSGKWRGHVSITHDPALESDGLLELARLAELCAVPALFGYSKPSARPLPSAPRPAAGALVQAYEVTWTMPNVGRAGAIGAAIGSASGLGATALRPGLELCVVGAAAGAALGGAFGVLRAREQRRRAEIYAQRTRVHALERSLSLKELGGRAEGGLEGSVVAGQYRVVRRMGSGATGVVYEAVRIADGLPTAIKLLRAAAAHDAVASDRLRREAAALGLSWHPNVVEVIDHGHMPDGTSYLVMELLRGESLASRVRSKGRLSPDELLPIALEACDALAAVHAAGVVHRDVKPSNIYLAGDRERPDVAERVKLLDFGIARVEWEETRITNTGGPLGTPGYMSPEQEAGESNVDARSDIFAMGAVLYECLVGEPPPPPTPSGIMRMRGPTASRADSGTQKAAFSVPTPWRAIIEKAMAVDPARRYQDARSLSQALRGMRDDAAKAGLSS